MIINTKCLKLFVLVSNKARFINIYLCVFLFYIQFFYENLQNFNGLNYLWVDLLSFKLTITNFKVFDL